MLRRERSRRTGTSRCARNFTSPLRAAFRIPFPFDDLLDPFSVRARDRIDCQDVDRHAESLRRCFVVGRRQRMAVGMRMHDGECVRGDGTFVIGRELPVPVDSIQAFTRNEWIDANIANFSQLSARITFV